MRFYLDEDLPYAIAQAAERLGLDVISSHEVGRNGTGDEEQLLYAAEQDRALVSVNRGDFWGITQRFLEQGLPHAGVLLLPNSMPRERVGVVAVALRRFADSYPDGVPSYFLGYLKSARSSGG